MTLAICLKCGAEKHGAWTPCPRCGFDPETPEDQAKALLLSDHNLSVAELKGVAQQIQSGKPPSFDEAGLKEMSEEIGAMDTKQMGAEIRRSIYGCFFVAVVIVVGLVGLVWLVTQR